MPVLPVTAVDQASAVDDDPYGDPPHRELDPVAKAVADPSVRFGLLVATASLVVLTFVGVLFPSPSEIVFLGMVLGSLNALAAVGMVLVYRANRVINFAQGDLGGVAAATLATLALGNKVPFFVAAAIGVVLAVVLGGLIEITVVRRFTKAPRLILTVATLGLAQILGGLQTAIPQWFTSTARLAPTFSVPIGVKFTMGSLIFGGSHLLVLVVAPVVVLALGAFFRFTRTGIAVRASAESSERALLLGIPVRRIGTLVWVLAAGLSGVAAVLRAPIVGVPIGQVLGPGILLRTLAAAVLGRMENLPVTVGASLLLGVVEQAVFFHTGRTILVDAVLFAIILASLLLQRKGFVTRADDKGQSSWQAVAEVRPIPEELRSLPEVQWAKRGIALVLAFLLLVVPLWLDAVRINLMGAGLALGMIVISLMVLTGWAGQISLGQWAFAGFGGAVAGTLALKGWNFFLVIGISGLVGAAVAVVIGLPALRIRGPFLAVTTFAFAYASFTYFLNYEFFGWFVPSERFDRPTIFGKFDLESDWAMYYVMLAFTAATVYSVRSLRRSRTGRVLLASRENERAAQAFGVNVIRARLVAFALSGFYAAIAGALFAYHQHSLFSSPRAPENALNLFSIGVLGGLGSIPGVLLGATFFTVVEYLLTSPFLRLFTTGFGLLFILLVLPGGLGQLVYTARDGYLRAVARRRGLVVASLLADTAVSADTPPAVSAPIVPVAAVVEVPVVVGEAVTTVEVLDVADPVGRPPDRQPGASPRRPRPVTRPARRAPLVAAPRPGSPR